METPSICFAVWLHRISRKCPWKNWASPQFALLSSHYSHLSYMNRLKSSLAMVVTVLECASFCSCLSLSYLSKCLQSQHITSLKAFNDAHEFHMFLKIFMKNPHVLPISTVPNPPKFPDSAPCPAMGRTYRVTGGASNGLLVRKQRALSSTACAERLRHGSVPVAAAATNETPMVL